jgi:acetyltransferase-like isoleucine patch superfamily enzyme
MLFYDNHKPLIIIGYKESTITQEFEFWFSQEKKSVEIIKPEEFVTITDSEKKNFQYYVGFTLDRALRKKILGNLNMLGLNQISYAHSTTTFGVNDPRDIMAPGCFIAPYSTLLLNSHIGAGTIIETYCLISHYVTLLENVHLHSGVMIAGRSIIGNDCMLNFRSTVLPKVTICDNVEIGAVSTVTKSIDQSGKYVGSPCRRVGDIEAI